MSVTSRLRILPDSVAFTDAVLRDLIVIRGMADGRRIFGQLQTAGVVLTVEKPDPPVRPRNAWTRWASGETRFEKQMVIAYDPADWSPTVGPQGVSSYEVMIKCLHHAVGMLETN